MVRARTRTLPAVVVLFGAGIFLAAGLVFLVQPMTAKMLLPTFGGSPQVWTAAMVFFQGALLAGYAWAHVSVSRFGRRQPVVHAALLLLPLLVLPIALRGLESADALPPAGAVVAILLMSVGAPYVAVAATSPLLQRWFSQSGHAAGRDPYFLYAAGNIGSLLGLLGYPLLIEPRLPVGAQGLLWSVGYVAFVALCIGCAVVVVRRGSAAAPTIEEAAPPEPIRTRRRLGWLVRAFIPSSLMLGVTTYSATDVAAVPLLWAIPLSLYLVTFVLAFAQRQWLDARQWAVVLPFTTALVILTIVGVLPIPIWARLAIHYVGFFVAAMVAHTQLADDRPSPAHLTGFYLILALGGVLGGIFNAIVAPAVFDAVLEYPLLIVLALLLRPTAQATRTDRQERRARVLDMLLPFAVFMTVLAAIAAFAKVGATPGPATLIAIVVVGSLATIGRPARHAGIVAGLLAIAFVGGPAPLLSDRTFFGLHRVVTDEAGRHVLVSGQTIHGRQRWEVGGAQEPLSYYHRTGPAGQVFGERKRAESRVAIVGLGAGSLAAYGQPGDQYTFIDIDPVVLKAAQDPRLFTFVAESRAAINIVEGDGRLWLSGATDASFDLIVIDAFSSDAIPAHLVTREALQLYASKLRSGGLLLFNVSNAYLDVRAVVAGGAIAAGLHGAYRLDGDLGVAPEGDKDPSEWVVLAAQGAALKSLKHDDQWADIRSLHRTALWTDGFSDLLGVLK